jgi:hypothetical protein
VLHQTERSTPEANNSNRSSSNGGNRGSTSGVFTWIRGSYEACVKALTCTSSNTTNATSTTSTTTTHRNTTAAMDDEDEARTDSDRESDFETGQPHANSNSSHGNSVIY